MRALLLLRQRPYLFDPQTHVSMLHITRRSLALLAFSTPLLAAPNSVGGQVFNTVQDGTWNDAATWDVGVPFSGVGMQPRIHHLVDVATPAFSEGDTSIGGPNAVLTVTTGSMNGGSWYLGSYGPNGTLNLNGGDFSAWVIHVGWTDTGTLNITSGNHTVGNIEVGENVGGSAAGECRMSCTGSAMSLNVTGPLEMFPNGTLALTPTANGAAGLSAIQVVSMQHWNGGGRFELDFSQYAPSVGDAWEIIHYSGGVNSFAAAVDAPAGYTVIEDQSIPGVIRLEVTGAPITGGSDDCATSQQIAGEGNFAWDTSAATTGTEGQSESLCYDFGTSGIDSDVWFEWTASATGMATATQCGNTTVDTKMAAYPAGGCPTVGSAIDCNDDTCGLQSELSFPVNSGTTYTIQVGTFPGASSGTGSMDISIQVPAPGTAYCFCDGSGTASPCSNSGAAGRGCANGTDASGAELSGSGVASVGADTLVLSGSGLPAGQPGLFFQGNNAVNGGNGDVFGDGLRCAGGSVIRLGVATSSGAGTSDTSGMAQPISVKGVVNPGDVKRYQLWYRDPVGSPCGNNFNLTNGFEVQW